MLTMALACRDAASGSRRNLKGLVVASGHGSVCDYWVSLLDEQGQCPAARATLTNYPRWAEPTRAFVARSLEAVLSSCARDTWRPSDACELTVRAWSTQHVVDFVAFGSLQQPPCANQTASALNPWEVMRWVCARDAFGEQDLPEQPRPISVTVYEHAGIRYCRTSDLPLEARVTFERLQAFLDRPYVPAVPDAVYPWWLESFLRDELSSKSMAPLAWR